jgi:cysteine desulfuration protein SufE
MSATDDVLPAKLAEIVASFGECEGPEKIELLLQYTESMPPLPAALRERLGPLEQVHECVTPIFVGVEANGARQLTFYFDIPVESPTVRGFAALMAEGLEGCLPEEVLHVPRDFFGPMGLQAVLTPQRMNGISAILRHMQQQARKFLPA